jgi:hypothetical protein
MAEGERWALSLSVYASRILSTLIRNLSERRNWEGFGQ